MTLQNTIISYESGLDYLTLSQPQNPDKAHRFVEAFHVLQKELPGDEGGVKRLKSTNYVGSKIGCWDFLWRPHDNHRLIRVHGSDAERFATFIEDECIPGKVTRIDAQITATFEKSHRLYAGDLRTEIRTREKETGCRARLPITVFEGRDADTGLTCGGRSGAIFGRIYDYEAKHRDSTTQRIWRYELEMKEDAATRFYEKYRQTKEHAKLCAMAVSTRLESWGIKEQGFAGLEPLPISGTRPASTFEKRLKWTESTLIPHLAKSIELGLESEIFALLRKHELINSDGVWISGLPERE